MPIPGAPYGRVAVEAARAILGPEPRKRRARPGQRESFIVRSILRALEYRGAWAWRANSGTLVIPESVRSVRRAIKGAPAGTPDVIGVVGRGRLFAIEVKRPGEKLRASQIAWKALAEEHGVLWGVATSAKEALELYDRWVRDLENERATNK